MKTAEQPAFPLFGLDPWGKVYARTSGMTKREHFASLAMQSLIVNPTSLNGPVFVHIAAGAVQMADYLIAELDRTSGEQGAQGDAE